MVWSVRLKHRLAAAGVVALATAAVAALGGAAAAAVTLIVTLVLAGVAIELASRARDQVERASQRALAAEAREREATLLADAASSLLAAPVHPEPVMTPQIEQALANAGARIQLCHAPSPRSGETALPLRVPGTSGWLYVDRDGPLTREDADRIQQGLSNLIGLAQKRARGSQAAAESEAERQSEVAKSAIMHAISHDFRTPLTAIRTAAGTLQEPNLSGEEQRELTAVVCAESDRLQRMVADLLDLSRIDAGAVDPHPRPCDLNDTLWRATERVRAERGEFGIQIDLPADLPRVHADAGQLERVFTNLIDNAAKFSPAEKPIEVRGVGANGRVTIRVVDHGGGISPGQQAQVFKPFVRGSDPDNGSGLGLAICRGFVEANGGRITLQSRGREGSAFVVSFPAAPQPSVLA
ncbi:MAG: two-component system, OmpR family, sensor histidine kinase KdpD [Candidatus Eremiobacteraeota bacterium]|nr:two-component system, OmpR family, sensor histidine kinase KdpD [Candidatus Eremiobacteraeota bacterium]